MARSFLRNAFVTCESLRHNLPLSKDLISSVIKRISSPPVLAKPRDAHSRIARHLDSHERPRRPTSSRSTLPRRRRTSLGLRVAPSSRSAKLRASSATLCAASEGRSVMLRASCRPGTLTDEVSNARRMLTAALHSTTGPCMLKMDTLSCCFLVCFLMYSNLKHSLYKVQSPLL